MTQPLEAVHDTKPENVTQADPSPEKAEFIQKSATAWKQVFKDISEGLSLCIDTGKPMVAILGTPTRNVTVFIRETNEADINRVKEIAAKRGDKVVEAKENPSESNG